MQSGDGATTESVMIIDLPYPCSIKRRDHVQNTRTTTTRILYRLEDLGLLEVLDDVWASLLQKKSVRGGKLGRKYQ